MSIQGIDDDKCISCRNCIESCSRSLFSDKEQDKITFQDSENQCSLCGHCIARCPEDAIIYEDIGEASSFEGINNPETIVPYNDMIKILQAHRSIRRFKKEKVPKDILKKVFDAMQCAPTARNMRSETFTIISDDEQIISLSDIVVEELLKNAGFRAMYGDRLTEAKKLFKSPVFFDAPHVVIVSSRFDTEVEANNIGVIITYGRLAASSLGLGTCWNGITQSAMGLNPKLRRKFGIRGKRVGVFAIGYPASELTFYRSAPRINKLIKGLD
jgi:nitroreductase/NAD-dependent dihydropyrimidine dehydrogenase PreA subunit